jgi:hypothetical protein
LKVKAAVIPQAAKTADNTGIPTDETPPSVVFQTVTAPGTWLKSQQPYTSETPCKIILTARDKAIPKFIRVVRKLQFLNNFLMSLRGAELRGIKPDFRIRSYP